MCECRCNFLCILETINPLYQHGYTPRWILVNRKSKWYKCEALKDRFNQSSTTHSNSRAVQKDRSNGELSTTWLSVKSMGMRPMYAPGITCWSIKPCVVYVWPVAYISRRDIFPHVQLQRFISIRVALFSQTTHPIIRTLPLRDTEHWFLRSSNANISWLQ